MPSSVAGPPGAHIPTAGHIPHLHPVTRDPCHVSAPSAPHEWLPNLGFRDHEGRAQESHCGVERPRTPSSRVRDGTAYVFVWFGFYALRTGCLRADRNHLCGALTAARPRPDGPGCRCSPPCWPQSLTHSSPASQRLPGLAQGRGRTWVSSPDGQARRQQARQPGPCEAFRQLCRGLCPVGPPAPPQPPVAWRVTGLHPQGRAQPLSDSRPPSHGVSSLFHSIFSPES